jgi:putative hydrolase of the HAD superfamily
LSKYKAVVFDLFGTVALWHPDRLPVFEWQGKSMPSTMGELQAAIEAGGVDAPFDDFLAALQEINEEHRARRVAEMLEMPSVHRFESALRRIGCPATYATHKLANDLSLTHLRQLAQAAEIPAQYIDFLQRVFADYSVALLSNFDHGPTARHILERDGASPYFHHIVISDDHGWRKPHPRIFVDTLALLRVEPSEALFVGDTFEDDVIGAQNLGMDCAWVNARDSEPPAGSPAPDYIVRAITDLEPILFADE